MSKTKLMTCLECGARLAEDAERCDLCGLPVDAPEGAAPPFTEVEAQAPPVEEPVGETVEADVVDEAAAPPPVERAMPAAPPVAEKGVFCNQCGWANPPDARFCSMCGAALQHIASAPFPAPPAAAPPEAAPARGATAGAAPVAAPRPTPPTPGVAPKTPKKPKEPKQAVQDAAERKAVTRQVGIIVGAGLLLVVVLFLATAVSKDLQRVPDGPAATAPPPQAVQQEALPPLPPQLVEQAAALEAEIARLDGEARLGKQRELVSLFVTSGRPDRAALVQQEVAEVEDTPDAWRRVGDLRYDWMSGLEGASKVAVALEAIDAYQRVLAVEPDNVDVRTDMATAYLSSNNPMQGVAEIKRVLETDPNHLHARFNYGIMLSMIGRMDQSIEQFEQVKTLVGPESSYYQQAEEALRVIRQGQSL